MDLSDKGNYEIEALLYEILYSIWLLLIKVKSQNENKLNWWFALALAPMGVFAFWSAHAWHDKGHDRFEGSKHHDCSLS